MAEETKVDRASAKTLLRRRLRFLRTRARELKMIGKALVSTKHPILVHIIPMRQCNLACTYCNEFDDFSKPVPLAEMKKRQTQWEVRLEKYPGALVSNNEREDGGEEEAPARDAPTAAA